MKLRNAVNGSVWDTKILDESFALRHLLLLQLQSRTCGSKRGRQTERPAMNHGTLPADRTEIIADGIGINAVAAEDLRIFFPQISGETYTLELHVECPLDDRFISESRKNFIRDTVAVRQIVELHFTVIYRNTHKRDSKIRRIGVSVHTTLGDVTVTPSLQINFYGFHGNTSLNPPGRYPASRPPDIALLFFTVLEGVDQNSN